jgi:hypothetical protein
MGAARPRHKRSLWRIYLFRLTGFVPAKRLERSPVRRKKARSTQRARQLAAEALFYLTQPDKPLAERDNRRKGN